MKPALPARAAALMTWVLLLVVLPLALYASHVIGQLGEVRDNNLRTLSKAADATTQVLENAVGSVERLDCEFLAEFVVRQPRLTVLESEEACPPARMSSTEFALGGQGQSDAAGGAVPDAAASVSANRAPEGSWQATVAVTGDGLEIWSRFTAAAGSPPRPGTLKFGVNLAGILTEIPFGNALDLLLVADENGAVIEQQQPEGHADRGLRIANLAGLPLIDDGESLKNEDLQRASTMRSVQVAGAEYELLCQPLNLASVIDTSILNSESDGEASTDRGQNTDTSKSVTEQSERFVLCGLVPSRNALTQSLQVAPFLALILFLVIIFAFLSWPVLKLLWMSERERLQFSDLCLLFVGTWLGLMLGTIVVFSIGAHLQLTAAHQRSLEDLADRVEANLQNEIDRLAVLARTLDDSLVDAWRSRDLSSIKDIVKLYASMPAVTDTATEPDAFYQYTQIYPHNAITSGWRTRAGGFAGIVASPEDETDETSDRPWPVASDFEFAFWARCGGQQAFKATIKNENTPRVGLSQRQYFQAAILDRLWPGTGDLPARYVQPLQSLTTGEFATVLSIRSRLPAPPRATSGSDAEGCNLMAAVQGDLISATRPVLSPGYGFAVINDNGDVLLHSEQRRALFENLYQEVEQGERLRSIVEAREPVALSSSYLGIPHHMFVKPIANLPWTLVTFADTELVSTNSLEIMGQAFILSVVYVLILIVIMAAYFLVNGPEIPRWFWPTAAGSDFSIRLAAVAVAAMVLSIMTLDGDALTRVVTIIPVLFFAVLYFAYRRPASETIGAPLPWSVGLLRKNTLASVANWLVIAVLPACGFIKVAADAENAILVRYENEYLAQQLAGRTCAIEDRYQDVDLSGICTNGECGYPAQRLTTSLDLYPSSMFLPDRAHWGDSARDALSARLAPFDDALPDATAEAGGATPEQAEAQYFERVSKRIWVRAAKGEPLGGEPRAQEPEPNYWSSLAWLKPIYGGTVVGTRYLDTPAIAEERARAGEWSWMPIDDQFVFGASSLACGTGLVIASGVPLHVDAVLGDWRVGIPAVILLAAVVLWTRYGVRRIFFGEIEDPVTHDLAQLEKIMAGTAPDQKLWLVAGVTSPAHRARLLTRRAADAESGGNFTRLDADSFGQGSRRRAALLQALRTAEYERRNVLLVTRGNLHQLVAPEDETTVADGDTTDALTPATADEWRSWRRLLSDARFLIVASVKPSGLQQSTSFWRRRLDRPASVGWLAAELGPLPEPETVKQQLLPALLGSTRRQALDRICDYASSFYFGLWDSCSEADKLVLVQLTFENVVNPKQSGVVRQLLERGLLARDPALRLFNRSFALFITRIHDPSETLKWEQHTAGFSWAQTRWVLVGFLLLGLLFLWTTQRELFNTGLMFVSAAAVGLPSALKLMTSLNKSSKEL